MAAAAAALPPKHKFHIVEQLLGEDLEEEHQAREYELELLRLGGIYDLELQSIHHRMAQAADRQEVASYITPVQPLSEQARVRTEQCGAASRCAQCLPGRP